MGSQAKFGVFSPAVYAAKIALGNDKLNKIRGQAISLHSQYIGDFCTWAGAYHLRTKLIKKVSCWMGKITLTFDLQVSFAAIARILGSNDIIRPQMVLSHDDLACP